jgi:hypothetical protein
LNWPRSRKLDSPWFRAILLKAKMSTVVVIIREVLLQDSSEMLFVEDDHMIHALSADRSNNALNVRVLPG